MLQINHVLIGTTVLYQNQKLMLTDSEVLTELFERAEKKKKKRPSLTRIWLSARPTMEETSNN